MYSVEVDTVDKEMWHKIISDFSDANIYQTWSYAEIRFGRKEMSHLILKMNNNIVAAVQVRIIKIPIIKIGIAYAFWGPLWKVNNSEINTDIFTQAIRALRKEYAERRGLLLRIYPVLFNDESDVFLPILKKEGFVQVKKESVSRTLLVDLNPDLDTLRKGLEQKWRNCLNRALKNDLELLEGDSDEMFGMFITLYRELLDRKQFVAPNDINEFRLIQENLPVDYRMKIILCRFDGKLCAGAIFSALGAAGVYLFGATNEVGMKSNGSYLIQWKFMEWLKENRYVCYNLHGINPITNPGTYKFKAGLCGKNGKDVYFLGMFDACTNGLSSLAIRYGDSLSSHYKKGRTAVHNMRNTLLGRFKNARLQLLAIMIRDNNLLQL